MTSTLALVDGVYDADTSYGTVIVRESIKPLTAAGIPVKPPTGWFDDPGLKAVTPLTISSDGQVFGHIATWQSSHIGMAGSVKPPKSKSNYAFFRTGVVETDDGQFVDVGQITLTGGHASIEASAKGAVAHYDDTASAVMDIAVGEDRHGIWAAGALRPDVDEVRIRSIRASAVSGDWRPINGRLELVAVCAVNCPGFPIPRARVAGGAPIALVAAGIEPIIEAALHEQAQIDVNAGITAGLTMFRARVRNLEAVMATTQIDQLRERVRPTPDPMVAAADLRSRVNAPKVKKLREKVNAPVVAALRSRVRGEGDAAPFDLGVAASLTADSTFKKLVHEGMKAWNTALHPRGKDGKFIETGGFVDGPFKLDIDAPEKKPSLLKRAKVVGFADNSANPNDPYIVVENSLGNKGYGLSSKVTQVAAPKAELNTPKKKSGPPHPFGIPVTDAFDPWLNNRVNVTNLSKGTVISSEPPGFAKGQVFYEVVGGPKPFKQKAQSSQPGVGPGLRAINATNLDVKEIGRLSEDGQFTPTDATRTLSVEKGEGSAFSVHGTDAAAALEALSLARKKKPVKASSALVASLRDRVHGEGDAVPFPLTVASQP